jgi:hypothetical protein
VDYAYPIVWWGVLLLVDAWNTSRRGLSLWQGNGVQFLVITVPLSVTVWLFFEALNLRFPQWRYRTEVSGNWNRVLLGFTSFATVIPIMVESWWLVSGRQCLPDRLLDGFRKQRVLCLALAAVATMLPLVNDSFWFNQGMWLVPALVVLPFARTEICSAGRFLRAMIASGLLAGLAWEAFNYPSRSHWEYMILPDVPHLFYMPLPGYLGFVPFAFSMLAVYEWQRTLRPSVLSGILLYAIATAGLYGLMAFYLERIWIASR